MHSRLQTPSRMLIGLIHFRALKDVVVPLQFPTTSADGSSELEKVLITKGTEIYISILGANRSKRIWGQDADEWKPSRWLEDLPVSVSEARLPGVYSQMYVVFHL